MSEQGENLIGRVAESRAGRDKGRAFLVVGELDAEHLLLADGCLRRLDRPKKKKRKHIRLQPAVAPTIQTKLMEGKQVFDAEIRNCLLNLGYNVEHES